MGSELQGGRSPQHRPQTETEVGAQVLLGRPGSLSISNTGITSPLALSGRYILATAKSVVRSWHVVFELQDKEGIGARGVRKLKVEPVRVTSQTKIVDRILSPMREFVSTG